MYSTHKILYLSILILLTNLTYQSEAFAQNNIDASVNAVLLLNRNPSAKSEAMGRTFMSEEGTAISAYFNPAALTGVKGISIAGSVSDGYFSFPTSEHKFNAIAYNTKKYGAIGFSYYSADIFGSEDHLWNNYTLSYALKLFNNFSIGTSMNYMKLDNKFSELNIVGDIISTYDLSKDVYYFDIGFHHFFEFSNADNLGHKFSFAGSLTNITNSLLESEPVNISGFNYIENYEIPSILRVGAKYSAKYDPKRFIDELEFLNYTITAEYQNLLNSEYRSGFKIGTELSIFEIFNFRYGYFKESINDQNFSINNLSKWKDSTFGFGLVIPFGKLSDGFVPIRVRYDYIDRKQTPFSTPEFNYFKNFSVSTLSINWSFK